MFDEGLRRPILTRLYVSRPALTLAVTRSRGSGDTGAEQKGSTLFTTPFGSVSQRVKSQFHLRLRLGARTRSMTRSQRLERVIGRALAGVSLIFGVQTIPFVLNSATTMNESWEWLLGLILYASLTAMAVTGSINRGARFAAVALSIAFLGTLVTWPFAAVNLAAVLHSQPWPWYLYDVACAASALAFTDLIASAYTLLIAVTYFLVRLTPSGGDVSMGHAALDSGYAFIVGIATVLIVTLLRRSARAVEVAEHAVALRYTVVTRELAFEVERTNVDMLLHDNVMSALLSAGATSDGDGEQHSYTAALARVALNVIAANGATRGRDNVLLTVVGERFASICRDLGINVDLTSTGFDGVHVPSSVADALVAAALQALTNSRQHAGPAPVHRTVSGSFANNRVTVAISDNGKGFDTSIPTNRLGIRHSIVERLTTVGGTAVVESTPGEGTTITLTWDTETVVGGGPAAFPEFSDSANELP